MRRDVLERTKRASFCFVCAECDGWNYKTSLQAMQESVKRNDLSKAPKKTKKTPLNLSTLFLNVSMVCFHFPPEFQLNAHDPHFDEMLSISGCDSNNGV